MLNRCLYIWGSISTLVPARDATTCFEHSSQISHHFNPRARTGRDHIGQAGGKGTKNFNPRARTGRDKLLIHFLFQWGYFNPRARTGRDSKQIQTFDSILSFFSKKPPKGSPFNAFLSEKAFGKRKNRPVSRCEPPRDFLFTAVSHYSCRNGQSTASQETHLWTLQLSLSLVRPMTAVTDLVGVSIMLSVTVNPMRLGASSRESSSFW